MGFNAYSSLSEARHESTSEATWDTLQAQRASDRGLDEVWGSVERLVSQANVVDVGCGRKKFVENWSRKLRARSYAGVDINVPRAEALDRDARFVRSGILSFLSDPQELGKLQERPAIFVVNAMNGNASRADAEDLQDFSALIDAMKNAMPQGGCVIGINSPEFAEAIKEDGSFVQLQPLGEARYFAFEKI